MPHELQVPRKLRLTLASAGTPQAFTTSYIAPRSLTVLSVGSNTGNIYVGDSSGNATAAGGVTLAPGERYEIKSDQFSHVDARVDVRELYFDGDVTSEMIDVFYMEPGDIV